MAKRDNRHYQTRETKDLLRAEIGTHVKFRALSSVPHNIENRKYLFETIGVVIGRSKDGKLLTIRWPNEQELNKVPAAAVGIWREQLRVTL